jgi:hypothetical protein
MVLSKPFPEWWEGEVIDGRARGQRGLFPKNYVQIEGEGESRIEEVGDETSQFPAQPGPNPLIASAPPTPLASDTYSRRLGQVRRF